MHFNINIILEAKGLLSPLHKWKLEAQKDLGHVKK